MESLGDLLRDHTLRTVSLGAALLGLVSGSLGTYAVLRRQSLLGDAISHAALPGIALAFLLTRSKEPLVLLLGAFAAGWIGTLAVMLIRRTTRIKEDTALGLVLSVFFGFGLVLLTILQQLPDASQAGLDRFLFGQAATLLARDVATIGALGLVALATAMLFWKEFKLLAFDPDYGASLGFPMRALDVVLTSVLVIAVVIGLQAVGVVLMAAMLVAPAAAARQWTNRLGSMMAIAALFGAAAGVSGAVLSSTTERLPTGPTIVLCLSAIAIGSFLLAPNRGLLWSWARQVRSRGRLRTETALLDLYELGAQHRDREHGHPASVLAALGLGRVGTRRSLAALRLRGLARRTEGDRWTLTREGVEEAERLHESGRGGAEE
jgi:manganese/zinc/iron transport system permease protein